MSENVTQDDYNTNTTQVKEELLRREGEAARARKALANPEDEDEDDEDDHVQGKRCHVYR